MCSSDLFPSHDKKVGRCEDGWELGETKVETTAEGAGSELLKGVPKEMKVMVKAESGKRKAESGKNSAVSASQR